MSSQLTQIARAQERNYSPSSEREPSAWQQALLRHKRDAIEGALREAGGEKLETVTILDVGCNDGSLLVGLAGHNRKLVGIDISPTCAAKARRLYGLNVQVGDASQALPYGSDVFDVVICSEIIEHIYDTNFLCAEVWRVLKSGGLIVVTTPNINCVRNRLLVLIGRYPYGPGNSLDGAGHGVHIRVYNMATLTEQLTRRRFRVLRRLCTHLLPIAFSTTSWGYGLNRILSRGVPTLGSDIIVIAEKP